MKSITQAGGILLESFLFTVDDDDKKQNVDDTPDGEGESGGSEACFVHARDIARIVLERSCNTT